MKMIRYSKLPTEQRNPATKNIDQLPLLKILDIINRQDRQVPLAVGRVKHRIAQASRLITQALERGGKIYLVGAGTSGRLGVLEAAECPPTFNTPPSLVQAIMAGGRSSVFRSKEGAEDQGRVARKEIRHRHISFKDVVIGIAASGVTPFVREALAQAKTQKASTVLIACNLRSPLKADVVIAPRTGPEVITGSTRLKAGTATKLILNMLTVSSMIQRGKVYENYMVDLQPRSRKLVARAIGIIQKLGHVSPKEATRLFHLAQGQAKPAILMARKKISYQDALKILKEAGGFLRKAME